MKDAKIGIDARMISHERASLLNSKLGPLTSKLSYPSQNLVDLVWVDKPSKSRAPLFAQGIEFTGAFFGCPDSDAPHRVGRQGSLV